MGILGWVGATGLVVVVAVDAALAGARLLLSLWLSTLWDGDDGDDDDDDDDTSMVISIGLSFVSAVRAAVAMKLLVV